MFLKTFSPPRSDLFCSSQFIAVTDRQQQHSTISQKKRDFTNKSTVAEVKMNKILRPLMLDPAVLNNLKLLISSSPKTIVQPLFGLLLGR